MSRRLVSRMVLGPLALALSVAEPGDRSSTADRPVGLADVGLDV